MENGTGLSASDVALLDGNNGLGGGNGFMWIFGLLILMGMFNGGWNNNAAATQQDVQTTAQYGNLLDGNRDLANLITNGTAQSVAAVNQAKYDNINVAKDIQSVLTTQLAEIKVAQANALANQNQCCTETRLEMANLIAGLNQNVVAQSQKVLDMITGNRMAEMQNQINQLQLAQATSGMLRFPNNWTYAAGNFPPLPTTSTSTTA